MAAFNQTDLLWQGHQVSGQYAFLDKREAHLREQVLSMNLLGELDTTVEECEQLAGAIAALIRTLGPSGATIRLSNLYPVCLAEFLVAVGIHDYHQGDFWNGMADRVGLPKQNYPSRWGELFEKILDACGLERFEDFNDEGASRFVSRILAHGGIPTYCLTDFFDHLLAPAVEASQHRELSSRELIQSWQHSSAFRFQVDKPVRRFLSYGGPVAEDFLARCIDMAEIGMQNEGLPAPHELGLPERIIDSFNGWLSERTETTPVSKTVYPRRLKSPLIVYDPWANDALNILLPQQHIGDSRDPVQWVATIGPWQDTIDVTSMHRGGRTATRDAEMRLPSPFSLIDIALDDGPRRLRSWRFMGVSKDHPYLAFTPDSGTLINDQAGLEPAPVWLVFPRTSQLMFTCAGREIPAHVLEEFPLLSGEWAQFRGAYVNLAGAECLRIRTDIGESNVKLRKADAGLPRARLDGGKEVCGLSRDDRILAYEGAPPALRLPLPRRSGVIFPPNRWQIRLRAKAGAQPRCDAAFDGLAAVCSKTDDADELIIELSNSSLLGFRPIGEFELTARGPLGRDARFDLLFIPSLEVDGPRGILVPTSEGPTPARLRVTTDVSISLSSDAAGITVERLGSGQYRIDAGPAINTVPIVLHATEADGGEARLSVPVPRLRWSLVGLPGQSHVFTDEAIFVSRDELDQAPFPAIVLDLSGAGSEVAAGLCLRDATGQSIYGFTHRPARDRLRFPLREVLDSIRDRSDARVDVVATIMHGHPGANDQEVQVGYITRDLQILNFRVAEYLAGAVRHVTLEWSEGHPVTDRRVRFWPLWRPWEDCPFVAPIPDDARGTHSFAVARALLPAGRYRIEMAVVDPWRSSQVPAMPATGASNCADISLGANVELNEYLGELSPEEPLGILEFFLATRDARRLDRLADTLDPHEVSAAIRAAMGIAADANQSLATSEFLTVALGELRTTLLSRPEMLPVIADLSGLDTATDHRLRLLVIDLGLMRGDIGEPLMHALSDLQRRKLWQLWSPLFFALEVDADRAMSNGAAAAFQNLMVGVDLGEASEMSVSQLEQLVSYRFSGTELTFSAQQLRAQRETLGLLPAGPLHGDTWILANCAWAIRMKENVVASGRAEQWLDSVVNAAQDDLDALANIGLRVATTGLRQRRPTADTGTLRWLPFVVGVTALVERALARGLLTNSTLMMEAARGSHSPREAFAAAPELYSRDLCLMDMLLCGER